MKILIFFLCSFLSSSFNVYAYSDNSNSSIVMDIDSGRVLYKNNIHEKHLIASTTKIMTAIIALERADLKRKVVVGDEIDGIDGTNIYVKKGEILSIEDLLYGLLLRSGNDAAMVLANNVGDGVDDFVFLMNSKAKELGMNNTTFSNPHGLDDQSKNYSTAYDMALLSSYCFHNKMFNTISHTRKYKTKSNFKSYIWYNKNKLLFNYKYIVSCKNGYTPKAKRTLVSSASKNGLNLTIVSLKDYDHYNNHKNLYVDFFNRYKNYIVVDKNKFKFNNKSLYLKNSFKYPLTKSESNRIVTSVNLYDNPVSDSYGYVLVKLDDKVIGSVNIYKKIKKDTNKSVSLFNKIYNYLELILKKLILGLQNIL